MSDDSGNRLSFDEAFDLYIASRPPAKRRFSEWYAWLKAHGVLY